MPVERREEGVVITTELGSTTVFPLKQAEDGTPAEVIRAWIRECASRMVPAGHPAGELEAYLTKLCDLEPLPPDHPQVRNFLRSLILRHFEDHLKHRPPVFSVDMTDTEMEDWMRETRARRHEAEKIPPERFGLKVRGFHLLHTEKNRPFIDADRREWWRRWGNEHCKGRKPTAEPEGYFCYEETTGEGSGSGFGAGALFREAQLFLGVTEADIAGRTPRFFGCLTALVGAGKLPSLPEFQMGCGAKEKAQGR